MKISSIIFDIGNVLVDFRWRALMAELDIPENKIERMAERWVLDSLWGELDRGVITEDEVIAEAKRRLPDCVDEIDRLMGSWVDIVTVRSDSADWLKGYRDRGYGVYVLSNYPKSLFELHLPQFDFLQNADGYIISAYEKLIKPEPDIYRLLLERYSLCAEQCIFIDDRQDNIEAARALGINAIQFISKQQVEQDIEAILSEER